MPGRDRAQTITEGCNARCRASSAPPMQGPRLGCLGKILRRRWACSSTVGLRAPRARTSALAKRGGHLRALAGWQPPDQVHEVTQTLMDSVQIPWRLLKQAARHARILRPAGGRQAVRAVCEREKRFREPRRLSPRCALPSPACPCSSNKSDGGRRVDLRCAATATAASPRTAGSRSRRPSPCRSGGWPEVPCRCSAPPGGTGLRRSTAAWSRGCAR